MSTTETITNFSEQIVAGLTTAEDNAVSFADSIVGVVKPLTHKLPVNLFGENVDPSESVRFAFGLAKTAVTNQTDLAVRLVDFYGIDKNKPASANKATNKTASAK
ncbi:MAG: hypothetical protein NVS3B21_21490 [Acidimicrobiales bacterium]